jgi:hypothetical protein
MTDAMIRAARREDSGDIAGPFQVSSDGADPARFRAPWNP